MDYSVIVASNNEEVLHASLLASPDLNDQLELNVQRGADSAALAYNRGIEGTRAETMMFIHQDLYLPSGWLDELKTALKWLQQKDPDWGVLGLFGVDPWGIRQGLIYSCGLQTLLGASFTGARQVETLDEVMLIIRRSSGLRFDLGLPGFHLYGADICLQARARGMKSYAIAALGIHNSRGIGMLPWAYWKCWFYLRRKWWAQLPIATPCMPITRWGGAAIRYSVGHPLWLLRRGQGVRKRGSDLSAIWRQLEEGRGISRCK